MQPVSPHEVPVSGVIAKFASDMRFERLPVAFVAFLKDHIIDVVGTSLAATRFDFAYRALAGLGTLADGSGGTVIGMPQRLPLKDAALMNGVLAHGLDYDDTHPVGPVHPELECISVCAGGGRAYRLQWPRSSPRVRARHRDRDASRPRRERHDAQDRLSHHWSGGASRVCRRRRQAPLDSMRTSLRTRKVLPAARRARLRSTARMAHGTSASIQDGLPWAA